MKKFDPIIEVKNDGLYIPEVRSWSLEKYKLVGYYCNIFTNGMKNIWDQLVYIDLFAGAGYSKIADTNKIYLSSALIAMSLPIPFTKYILCEKDEKRYDALDTRVKRDFKNLDFDVICADSNNAADAIMNCIPKFGKGNTLLPFCFVDPYSLNLNFATIEKLATKKLMDFLILQALHMDANRNFEKYIKDENNRIAEYLGMKNWREEFEKDGKYRKDFVKFLADQYQKNMMKLEYLENNVMHQIRSDEKNLPLYYLSFYSKHKRGIDFFTRIEKYCTPQLKMDL